MNEFVEVLLNLTFIPLMAVIPAYLIMLAVLMVCSAIKQELTEKEQGIVAVVAYITAIIIVLSILEW